MAEVVSTVMDNLILPAILIIAAVLIAMIKKFLEKITRSIEIKNEMGTLEKRISIRNKLITLISENVKAAVAANMQLANEYKEQGRKLTPEEAENLRKSANQLVMGSLPESLKGDGVLLEIIGGTETLQVLINALIEKYVYEYKTNQVTE